MKRFLGRFLIIIIALALCGCGEKRLSAEEYRDTLAGCYNEYVSCRERVEKTNPHSSADADPEAFSAAIKAFEDSLSAIANISPPEDYVYYHNKLLKGIELDRSWLNLQRKLMNCVMIEDEVSINAEIRSVAESEVYIPRVYKEIKASLDMS